jgi:phytoene dehydrogenase-like protein
VNVDAVVIGAGPNGLVAANLLADAGWEVLVLEEQETPGGAVKSAEVTAPGFVSDLYSAFYPLGVASPALTGLELEKYGLSWRHAPNVLAHPLEDGRTAVLSRDIDQTVASVSEFARGDGAAWRDLVRHWQDLQPSFLDVLLRPFPPVRAGAGLARRLGVRDGLRFARFSLLSVRRYAEETFEGEGAALLLAGNAMHTDLPPEDPGSALFGWLLAMLAQTVGFPVPAGGAGCLTDALVRRLTAQGGQLRCGAAVRSVSVHDGRAAGVRLADGSTVTARRAVLADVSAPALYLRLLGPDLIPERLRDDLRRFDWDDATIKIDWALSEPVPWKNAEAATAGTVHLGGPLDEISTFAHNLALGRLSPDPFLLFGQMSKADPSRCPPGTEVAWAYTHVPAKVRGDAAGELSGSWDDPAMQVGFLDRMERRVEQFAPGFRDLIQGRHVVFPGDLERQDANLRQGALNGGTSSLYQQLIFRPTPGLGRPETHIEGLYLASASAHPGGGVHGVCGANAAHAALRARTTGRIALAAQRALLKS